MTTDSRRRLGHMGHGQRGATLLIGLVMLMLLTLHALAAFTAGTTQLRIVGNMQDRQDAQAAANLAIGQVLSSAAFVVRAHEVGTTPVEIDVNGDGAGDFQVLVTPACTAVMPLRGGDLDAGQPEDVQCMAGTAFGSASLCAASHWNLQAVAVPAAGRAATGATAEINQGVKVRIDRGEARTFC